MHRPTSLQQPLTVASGVHGTPAVRWLAPQAAPSSKSWHSATLRQGNSQLQLCSATKQTAPDSLGDVVTRAVPSAIAERKFDKRALVEASASWQEVATQFQQMGDTAPRNAVLVGEMLARMCALLPPLDEMKEQDVRTLVLTLAAMVGAMAEGIDKLNVPVMTNAVWTVARLPDALKLPSAVLNPPSPLAATRPTPAAASAAAAWAANRGAAAQQARTAIAAFGAALLGKRQRIEELMNTWVGLTLAGYIPPRAIQADDPEQPQLTFGGWLQLRSGEHLWRLQGAGVGDAALVATRLVAPGQLSQQWLAGFAEVAEGWLPELPLSQLVYTGYCLARHSYAPTTAFQSTFLALVTDNMAYLEAADYPMLLYTLARWSQLHAAAPQLNASIRDLGVDQQWLEALLLGSYKAGALRTLPLAQLSSMLRALGVLQLMPSAAWLQRCWPAATAHLKAAAAVEAGSSSSSGTRGRRSSSSSSTSSSSVASDALGMLTAVASLPTGCALPSSEWVEEVLGYVDSGLTKLTTAQLAELTSTLQRLGHAPDDTLLEKLQAVAVQRVSAAGMVEWPTLLTALTTGASSRSLRYSEPVVVAVAAAAAKAASKPGAVLQQDASRVLLLPEALLSCAVCVHQALAADTAVSQGLKEAAADLKAQALAAVAAAGGRMQAGQLLDSLEILILDLYVGAEQLGELLRKVLPGGDAAAPYSSRFSVADSVELLQMLEDHKVGAHQALLDAMLQQLQEGASPLGKRARAKTPEKAAAIQLSCSLEDASALQNGLDRLNVKIPAATVRAMNAAFAKQEQQQQQLQGLGWAD